MRKFFAFLIAYIRAARAMDKALSQIQSNNRCHCPEFRAEVLRATNKARASRISWVRTP
jgi:hypothetical protein